MNQTRTERILWLRDKLDGLDTQGRKWAEELARLEETERYHAAKREARKLARLEDLGIDELPEDEAPRQFLNDEGRNL